MYRFCLTRQINEVEILRSVFCGEGELCVWNETQYAKFKQDVESRRGGSEDDDTPQVQLQLNLPLDPPYPQDTLSFNITMPAFYPSSDGVELKMKVPRKILSQEQESELNDAATKFVESKVGQEIVLDLVQFVKEWIYDNVPPVVEPEPAPVSAPIQIEKSQSLHASLLGSSPGPNQSPSSKGFTKPPVQEVKDKEFRRILIWFSTIAPDRAKTVGEWAKQLGLTGIFRLGSPAMLLVEGQKADVDEYVSSLRSFRWKKMEIVWEDRTTCSNINDCRRFTQFQECMVTLPELQPIFKNAGLEEMYKEGLKIRG